MRELTSIGVLVKPKDRNMEEQVMPWLLDRIVDFLHEDDAAFKGSQNVIDLGLTDAQSMHKDVIKAKY